MKTTDTYKIENEMTGKIVKENLNFAEVKKWAFMKKQSAKFSPVALTDYKVINEVNGDYMPASQL